VAVHIRFQGSYLPAERVAVTPRVALRSVAVAVPSVLPAVVPLVFPLAPAAQQSRNDSQWCTRLDLP